MAPSTSSCTDRWADLCACFRGACVKHSASGTSRLLAADPREQSALLQKVIFATLVYDPELSVRFDALVWQYTVDLVQLEGSRASIIVDTDGEPDVSCFLFHALSPDTAFA